MTDKNDPSQTGPLSLDDSDIVEVERPSRRSAIARVGALVASAVFGAAALTPGEAEACRRRTGRTDSDPNDGVNRGRTGLTDSDSGDEAQCGRGSRSRGRRRCTDSDPNDGVNHGRHC